MALSMAAALLVAAAVVLELCVVPLPGSSLPQVDPAWRYRLVNCVVLAALIVQHLYLRTSPLRVRLWAQSSWLLFPDQRLSNSSRLACSVLDSVFRQAAPTVSD